MRDRLYPSKISIYFCQYSWKQLREYSFGSDEPLLSTPAPFYELFSCIFILFIFFTLSSPSLQSFFRSTLTDATVTEESLSCNIWEFFWVFFIFAEATEGTWFCGSAEGQ